MPFRCKICELDILPGAPMVSNERDDLAHETCVRPVVNAVHVTHAVVPKSIPIPPPEPCALPSSPRLCAVCGDPCISMCGYCHHMICQAYGWNGKFCSQKHEEVCSGARASRMPKPKPPLVEMLKPSVPIYDIIDVRVAVPKNGKHKSSKGRGKRR